MKRFKYSILAVVAILAIGLTAFAKFEHIGKQVHISNCYTGLTSDCIFPLKLVYNLTTCANSLAQDEKAVNDIGAFSSFIECPFGDNEFCCAKLVQITSPICGFQRKLTFLDKDGIIHLNAYAKIDAVFCRD